MSKTHWALRICIAMARPDRVSCKYRRNGQANGRCFSLPHGLAYRIHRRSCPAPSRAATSRECELQVRREHARTHPARPRRACRCKHASVAVLSPHAGTRTEVSAEAACMTVAKRTLTFRLGWVQILRPANKLLEEVAWCICLLASRCSRTDHHPQHENRIDRCARCSVGVMCQLRSVQHVR